ncbi:aminoacyl-tRNA deacylase [Actinomycetaceae bacterium MB13-C1-2]|nr:aminoacyl-tRNA deacylase [Actinomycetaceae bacterium MB13-C1-2]
MGRAKSGELKHPATPATMVLDKAKVPWMPHMYEHDPRSASYGLEAATALGIDPDRVFKTLVVTVEGKQGIAVIPASHTLNLKSAAVALAEVGAPKARTVELADERTAQAVTGYVIGGISPLGTKRELPTVLDRSSLDHDTILVSGGRRGFSVELVSSDLCRLVGAITADLTR